MFGVDPFVQELSLFSGFIDSRLLSDFVLEDSIAARLAGIGRL